MKYHCCPHSTTHTNIRNLKVLVGTLAGVQQDSGQTVRYRECPTEIWTVGTYALKAYMHVFVSLIVEAVHFTTDASVVALQRFVARQSHGNSCWR